MNWVAWQQHKKQFLIIGVLLALFAALVIPTGWHFWNTYQQALSTCDATNSCSQLADTLFRTGFDSRMLLVMKIAVVAIPFVLALFLGVPLIAREYSEGTNLLAWTQGVSRRKWLTVKLAWLLTFAAAAGAICAVLSTWWWRTGNALYLDRFQPLSFGVQGLVPVAFAVFAVAVGIAFGAWLKRLLPAMALTLGTLIAVQVTVTLAIRPHYVQPVSYTAKMDLNPANNTRADEAPLPQDAGAAWMTASSLVSPQGEPLNWSTPPDACAYTREEVEEQRRQRLESNQKPVSGGYISRDGGPIVGLDCLSEQGYTWRVAYQPSYRYWNFQRIEAGLYAALALVPLAVTYLLVRKRDA